MYELPIVSGQEVVLRPRKIEFVLVRRKGSHMILRREVLSAMTVTVPDRTELKRGTLKNILCQTGLTIEEFDELG